MLQYNVVKSSVVREHRLISVYLRIDERQLDWKELTSVLWNHDSLLYFLSVHQFMIHELPNSELAFRIFETST